MKTVNVKSQVEFFGSIQVHKLLLHRRWAVVAMLLTLASIVHAQVPTSTLNGTIVDPQDAVIVGAHVVAVSDDQGVCSLHDDRSAERNFG